MRPIDADVLYEKVKKWEHDAQEKALETSKQYDKLDNVKWFIALTERSAFKYDIADAPTIDAVHVVRCKDCKWWGLSEKNTSGIYICKKFNGVRFDTDFCSRAERSEE